MTRVGKAGGGGGGGEQPGLAGVQGGEWEVPSASHPTQTVNRPWRRERLAIDYHQ
jgi:hypothetical protein